MNDVGFRLQVVIDAGFNALDLELPYYGMGGPDVGCLYVGKRRNLMGSDMLGIDAYGAAFAGDIVVRWDHWEAQHLMKIL